MLIGVPCRVRVPLGDLPWLMTSGYRLVHVGQSAATLAPARPAPPADKLLAITGARRGLVPGGICVPDDDAFDALRARLASVPVGGSIDLSPWRFAPPLEVAEVDLRLRPLAILPDAVRRLLLMLDRPSVADPARLVPMDPRPFRALAGPLTRAALTGDHRLVTDLARSLVGAGPGATPTGDDVLVGVLAGLDAATGVLLPASTALRARGAVQAALPRLLHRTTAPSGQVLAAAVDGQFGEHVHRLAGALTDPDAVPGAVDAARAWGATSGVDLASGMAMALASLCHLAETSSAALVTTQHRRSA